jgi:hypothetical protein
LQYCSAGRVSGNTNWEGSASIEGWKGGMVEWWNGGMRSGVLQSEMFKFRIWIRVALRLLLDEYRLRSLILRGWFVVSASCQEMVQFGCTAL